MLLAPFSQLEMSDCGIAPYRSLTFLAGNVLESNKLLPTAFGLQVVVCSQQVTAFTTMLDHIEGLLICQTGPQKSNPHPY